MDAPVNILLIEDHDILRRMLEFRLAKEGYAVTCASDGAAALKLLDTALFGLIIIDMVMPGIGGLEVLKAIRQELKLSTPVIMLTSVDLDKTVQEALELGADDFIIKPFDPGELVMRMNRIVRGRGPGSR